MTNTPTEERRFTMEEVDKLARLVTKAASVIALSSAVSGAKELIGQLNPYKSLPHVQELLEPLGRLQETAELYQPKPMRPLLEDRQPVETETYLGRVFQDVK